MIRTWLNGRFDNPKFDSPCWLCDRCAVPFTSSPTWFREFFLDTGKFVSLYHHLETKFGIKITSARDNIKAKVADFLESELLQVSIGSPLLVDRRITFSGSKPIEAVVMIVDASKYDFSVNLIGRPG